jgi:chemotaxis methyl-accepting protein methylase
MQGKTTALARAEDWVLSEQEFFYFRDLIGNIAGISLSTGKKELIRSRLRSQVQSLGYSGFTEYRKHLESLASDDPEWQKFVNLLTTNKTDFFREPKHFDFLIHDFIPQWLRLGEKTLKIWSCASSTGEEPYTLAMVLKKYLPKDRDFKILATDIDTNVLAKAKNAVYPISKLIEIPLEYQTDSINRGSGEVANWFHIKSDLKDKIVFKQHNLVENTYPGDDVFDLILCRNLLIYFSPETIGKVVQKLYQSAKPDGFLFIGHSESLQGISTSWKMQKPSIFSRDK